MAKLSELTIDLSIGNIEETVTELKRVQREAKKATQAIREMASMLDANEEHIPSLLSAFSTTDLINALMARGATSEQLVADEIILHVKGVNWVEVPTND